MAIGIAVNKTDGSKEVVAVFKHSEAEETVDYLILQILKRGYSASKVEDVRWPIEEEPTLIWKNREEE